MDNKRFAELVGVPWHEFKENPAYLYDERAASVLCSCGNPVSDFAPWKHDNPDYAADPRLVLWIMRERPDFQDFYRFIGSYYCREFHAWMHDEKYMLDKTGLLRDRAGEWLGKLQPVRVGRGW